jgi:hypothetical protein
MGVLWDNSLIGFLVVTCFLGGGAAFMTGRAMAKGWKPYPQLIFYCVLIAFVVRFLNFALYEGELLTAYYFLVHLVIVVAVGLLGFRMQRARQMVRQYPWLNEATGPLSWRGKTAS